MRNWFEVSNIIDTGLELVSWIKKSDSPIVIVLKFNLFHIHRQRKRKGEELLIMKSV
jgi:hypothetical protein